MMMLRRPRRPPSKHHVVTNVKEMKEDAKKFGENKRRLLGKRKFEEGNMPLRKLGKTPPKPPVVTSVKEMKENTEEFVENKRRLSDKGNFEEGSVTSADEVSICTSENIKKDEGGSYSMRAESVIGKDGGMLDIQNTGVSLEIPPGALRRDYFVQMRIIPHHYLDETELSFASNSSVMVELLPNNVKLLKPAILTLPHCLVLKKICGWKAKVYSSHHEEGNQPQWEEEINTQCDVTYETCVLRLYNFSWKKVQIGDDKVEAKRIMLYAAMRSSIENEIFLDIGYYWQLPTCREILNLNDAIVLHERPFVFFREGQLPLTIILNKVVPPIWKYNEETNAKKISFRTVAITYGCFLPFTLEKGVSDKTDGCACSFQAGQGPYLVDLMFSLKESSLSRNEATTPSTGNATAGDTHKELPSAIVKTEEIAVSDESLQVTSADEVSIRTGENTKKDECDSLFIRTESMIGNAGGTLGIQNTGVSLEIPPGALRRDYLIQIRIIRHHYLDETELSFASNSSVVVELLPNNVQLSKPATLTLPHCLVLKKKCEWNATVYSSHHVEGNQRQWKEERNTQCELTHETCVMRLYNFCWKKVQIGDDIVEAKRIMLYASMRSSIENEIFLDIGYYWQLPRCREILNLNDAVVLHERPAMFFKEGQLPLTITLNKVVPPIWKYNEETNAKIISFTTVVFNEGDFCTFNLKKGVSDETDGCACFFKAGQGSYLVELMFSLKESSLSRAEAIIPSTGNGTAGDSQEELPSAISKTIVCDKILQELKKLIGTSWRDVGRNLKLTDHQIDNLIMTYNNLKHEEMVYQMLLEWKKINAGAATFDVLADALGDAERVDLRDWLLGRCKPT